MGRIGELLVIVLVFVVLFGGSKLGDLGKGLGDGIRNFKNSIKGHGSADDETDKPPRA